MTAMTEDSPLPKQEVPKLLNAADFPALLPIPEVEERIVRFGRGTWYSLFDSGKVQSVVMVTPGRKKGRRMIVVSSLIDWINECSQATTEANAAKAA